MSKINLIAILFLMGIFFSACSTVQPSLQTSPTEEPAPQPDLSLTSQERLKAVRADWKLGHYEAVVAKTGEISCTASDTGCNELLLISGHACFRVSNYKCAANYLELGMQQTEAWHFDALGFNRQKTHLNLLESLRSIQGTEKGEAWNKVNERLLNRTQEFIALEPKNPVGAFFLGSAQFARVRKELSNPKDARRLCRELGSILSALQKAGSPSSSIRYETYYRQLLSDISVAQQGISGCS